MNLINHRCFEVYVKIPISKTPNELAEMDFYDFVDQGTFPHLQDTYARHSIIVLIGDKVRGCADKAANASLKHTIAFFGAPDIINADKDPRSTWAQISQICRDHNISLQTVIRGDHQSLGATERRHMYYKDTTQQIIDAAKRIKIESKDWA